MNELLADFVSHRIDAMFDSKTASPGRAEACATGSAEDRSLLESSLSRIKRWRLPPNWGSRDWEDELLAIARAAAWQARCEYDPAPRVPFEAFLRLRIRQAAYQRYRQEWR